MSKEQQQRAQQKKMTQDIIKDILYLLKNNNIISDYKLTGGNGITSILVEEVSDIITKTVSDVNITNKNGKNVKNKIIKDLTATAKNHIKKLLPIDIKTYALITAADMKKYAIISNSGQLGERIRQFLWDAQRTKQYAFADYCVFLHTPGKLSDDKYNKEHKKAKNQFNKYINTPNSINSLDYFLSEEEFFWKFANIFIASKKEDDNDNSGQIDDARGKVYELLLAIIFKFEINWKRWNGKTQSGGFMYNMFCQLMNKFTENRDDSKIDDIIVDFGNDITELLPSSNPDTSNRKRKPKTDVRIKIKYKSETEYTSYTISAKCSSAESVSAHEYRVYDFIEALDLGESDKDLIKALNDFQDKGNFSDMKKENKALFKAGIIAHKEALYKWVITGECVNEKRYPYITDRALQIANYLVCYNPKTKETLIHTSQDYINYLLTKKIKKNNHSGTPLTFTHPSGGKGNYIQIKIPLNWHKK